MKWIGFASLTCAAVLAVGCNGARDEGYRTDDRSVVGTTGETSITSGDRNFVEQLTYAGAAEVELGKLAVERASNAEVRKFGQMMIDDHTKAGNELKQIAMQFHVPQPAGIDEFDKAYMDAMVDGHEDVADALEARVDEKDRTGVLKGDIPRGTNVKPESADDSLEASLNMWSATTLPAVKAHLERAKQLEDLVEHGRRNSTN
jgi:putative membrane protein